MATLVEVAFGGKFADETVKKMGHHFAYDNRPMSVRELAAKLRTGEDRIWGAIIRLKDDMEVMEDKMDHEHPIGVGDKRRIENKFRIKDEYIGELKGLVLRNGAPVPT
ncbi:MAG: hypothetical protein KGH66_00760 [Candidatus Micrarchaeota archaeon]|nr:hypothetical protein [Candidatus Micrarchaeota archaeon]